MGLDAWASSSSTDFQDSGASLPTWPTLTRAGIQSVTKSPGNFVQWVLKEITVLETLVGWFMGHHPQPD